MEGQSTMSECEMNIWGREFNLSIEYDCYSGEAVSAIQEMAIKSFISKNPTATALDDVKQYCIRKNGEDIEKDPIDNIFKYVKPKYLYVKRTEQEHIVAIMCDYKYDADGGIAVVFVNENFYEVGKQEIIL